MNPFKLLPLAIGLGLGYVLGTRAGREKYDALVTKVNGAWESPRVAKARHDVEAYARQQAPIIRERAEAAAKAAPGVIADTAKDVAAKTTEVAKDVAGKTTEVAKDVAAKTTATAKDVAAKTTATAKSARAQATKAAADLRERGEDVVDRATQAAGKLRDDALDTDDDK
jgi:hypothetical protein